MGVQLTIRNVSSDVRDELAARAALRGQSMQEYLREQLERFASQPSIERWLDRVKRRKAASKRELGAAIILSQRDADRR